MEVNRMQKLYSRESKILRAFLCSLSVVGLEFLSYVACANGREIILFSLHIEGSAIAGSISGLQLILCAIMVIRCSTLGLACSIVAQLLIAAESVRHIFMEKDTISMPAVFQSISYIILMCILYYAIREIGHEKERIQRDFDFEVQRRINSQRNLLEMFVLNLTKNRIIQAGKGKNVIKVDTKRDIEESFFQKIYHAERIPDYEKLRENMTCKRLLEAYYNNEDVYYEYRRISGEGYLVWVGVTVKFMKNPQNDDIIAFVNTYDINERKIAEDLIKSTVHYDYDIIASVDVDRDMVTPFDAQGMESAVEKKKGSFRELLVKQAMDVQSDDIAMYQKMCSITVIREELEKNDCYEFTCRFLGEQGEVRIKRIRFARSDATVGTLLFTRNDITDTVQMEKEQQEVLEEALSVARHSSMAKTNFLANMSHDIRTPMNAIVGMTDLALEDESNSYQIHESLTIIKESAAQLLHLINDILDMTKIERGEMTTINESYSQSEMMDNLISQARALAIPKKQKVDYFSEIIHDYCIGDAVRIQRVLTNVLGNAIKFTPQGGTVTIKVKELPFKGSHMFTVYRYEICDTGMGMTAEQIEHIFEPFYRTERKETRNIEGTGLGLSIVKSIVDAMGGTIAVESKIGVGTKFTIHLSQRLDSRQQEVYVEEKIEEKAKKKDLSHISVLLVEDHPVNQKVNLMLS